mmetsp:Transcript_104080/g.276941  ORF Transcript_104080/g.276941 Transcript_104080/m.276941 type:complete len:224 (-) Transcript_104080:107-778(-)
MWRLGNRWLILQRSRQAVTCLLLCFLGQRVLTLRLQRRYGQLQGIHKRGSAPPEKCAGSTAGIGHPLECQGFLERVCPVNGSKSVPRWRARRRATDKALRVVRQCEALCLAPRTPLGGTPTEILGRDEGRECRCRLQALGIVLTHAHKEGSVGQHLLNTRPGRWRQLHSGVGRVQQQEGRLQRAPHHNRRASQGPDLLQLFGSDTANGLLSCTGCPAIGGRQP